MKKLITILLLILTFGNTNIFSQNLVRNGSFEELNIPCVHYGGAFNYNLVLAWYANGVTPDLLNSCDTPSTPPWLNIKPHVGVPYNIIGYQYPNTGLDYAGIAITPFTNFSVQNRPKHYYSEIISTKLKNQLDSGITYSFSMKVSVANGSNLFTDGLGVCATKDSSIRSYAYLISSNLADISYKGNGFYMDTLNWFVFSGTIKADGTEKFLHIGDLDSIKEPYDTLFTGYFPGDSTIHGYYYIDDVALWRADDSVYTISDIGQGDTTICYGDSILLGSSNIPDNYYRWQHITHGAQNVVSEAAYDNGFMWVKPTKTTTYILETTNCIFQKTYDTVVVKVRKCGPNAGLDTAICQNSNIILGDSSNMGYQCQWWPNIQLSSDTMPMPQLTATQTMTYFLTVKDNQGNVVKYDSVHITTGPCFYSVEVAPNDTICKGDTAFLGMHFYPGAQYEWTPNWLLNNNHIAKPFSIPDTTITYTLKLTDIAGNISYDSITITVVACSNTGITTSTQLSQKAKVYPNPTNSILNIDFDNTTKTVDFILTDILGHKVKHQRLIGNHSQINISQLPKGIYLYFIEENGIRKASGKVVVE